jgi:hypothetical protein
VLSSKLRRTITGRSHNFESEIKQKKLLLRQQMQDFDKVAHSRDMSPSEWDLRGVN